MGISQLIRPAILLAAPHRIPFLAGSIGLGGLACWWLVQLLVLENGGPALPQGDLPPALLHGPTMLYSGLAPFIFGFLLTVFPRWIGLPDLPANRYAPIEMALLAGVVAVQIGLWGGLDRLVMAGFAALLGGWAIALAVLGSVLRQGASAARPRCWHAWSAWTALLLGLVGLSAALAFLWTGDAASLRFANRIGIGGLLLPIFLTVAHRMIPFFAANVVQGYVRWRPDWLLAVLWGLLAARLGAELALFEGLRVAANGGLAATTALMCWKWWPRASAPGLLTVLIGGFAWAPVAFTLSVVDALVWPLGRAPDHALLIGFSGSLLIAMVTRVAHGHSGRPLAMSRIAWLAFAGVQLAAITRIMAAIRLEDPALLIVAASLFAAGLLPWAIRNGAIYLAPRRDGKPG